MKIGPHNTDEKVVIIAEIGNNHEGDFELAKTMIDLAADSGVDAVKFQTFITEDFVGFSNPKRTAQLKKYELTQDQFRELHAHATARGILFLSTPFDLNSARFLDDLVPAYKIASSDNNFYPLLRQLAQTGKPLIMSTGLMELDEVEQSKAFIEQVWQEAGVEGELAILHCVSSYPVQPEEAGLGAISALKDRVGGTVGYSDHTIGIDAAVLSVGLGARIIEKHFTIDNNHSDFRDHQLSADPASMKALVEKVRQAETLLGETKKAPQASEVPNIPVFRRSIVAAHDIAAGTVLGNDHLMWTRPGGGLPPGQEDKALGKTLGKALKKGDLILEEDLQ